MAAVISSSDTQGDASGLASSALACERDIPSAAAHLLCYVTAFKMCSNRDGQYSHCSSATARRQRCISCQTQHPHTDHANPGQQAAM